MSQYFKISSDKLRAAVKLSCTCGGRSFASHEACPACKVWHRATERRTRSSPELAEDLARQVHALRCAGLSELQIAGSLKLSVSSVHHYKTKSKAAYRAGVLK